MRHKRYIWGSVYKSLPPLRCRNRAHR